MKKYKKKGSLGKTENGELVLVNSDGQAFSAGDIAIVIWDMCDGKATSDQLATSISEKTTVELKVIKPMIERLLENLENAGLMESIE